jgi:hypothetical protein
MPGFHLHLLQTLQVAKARMNSNPFHPEQVRRYFDARLPGYKWNGRPQISARCPFHDDSTASFSLNLDEGVWCCHAGCGSGGILDFEERFSGCDHGTAKAAVSNLLEMDLGPDSEPPEATYTYRDAVGRVVFRKLRFAGKTFRCEQPAASGRGWASGLASVQAKPLYNLPEVIRATYVIVVEGEKDADRLAAENLAQFSPDGLPLAITTNFDGAAPGHWRPEYGPYFAGKQVTIFPDNDQTGREHAMACARGIYAFAAGVKIVNPPGLPEHGDVSGYLDAGHSAEELIAEIGNAPAWRPDAAELDLFTPLVEIVSQGAKQAEWVIGRYVERSAITCMSAKIKYGKSSLLLSASRAVLEGRDFLGQPAARGPVVMVSEMSGNALIAGLQRAGLESQDGLWIVGPHKLFGLSWAQIVAAAAEKCRKTNAVLLAFDTLGWAAHLTGTQENDAGTMMEVYRPLQQIAGSGFAIWTLAHERKSGGEVGDAARGSSAAGGCADILMSLGKPEGNHRSETIRKISAIGRFPETPSDLVIDWTPANEYVVVGNSDAVVRDRATQAILDALPFFADNAKTILVLREETSESRRTIQRVLKELKAVRTGTGTTGDPFKYHRREIGGGR